MTMNTTDSAPANTPEPSQPGQDKASEQHRHPDANEEAEAMEEAQKEGAEQREQGGYQ